MKKNFFKNAINKSKQCIKNIEWKNLLKTLSATFKEFSKNFNKKDFAKAMTLTVFFSAALGITLAGAFLKGSTLEGILFYAKVPMSDGSTQTVNQCLVFCIPPAIHAFVILSIISFVIIINEKKIVKHMVKPGLRHIRFFGRHFILSSLIMLILSGIYFGNQIEAFPYLKSAMQTTYMYDEEYTDPKNQEYSFPETKKNLIYIFLESMETSYAAIEDGGLMKENYMPHLTQLARENTSFSDTELLGGAQSVRGTTWTAAAMVTQTSGIPLTIPIAKTYFGKNGTFLPGAYSIGEILEEAGYNQMLMVGSKASYAKRKQYFEEHGNYEVFDYNTAVERGYIDADYFRWWGFEDKKLFAYAKDEILRLNSLGQPFNFTLLTVDTHFTDGYKCMLCQTEFDNQYANVIKCSDTQLINFINWIKEQDFYKDTVIVLAGDHLTMDNNYFNRVSSEDMERGRRIYNCFINAVPSATEEIKTNRVFTTIDMFPTTLSALGVTWKSKNSSAPSHRLGLGVDLFSGEPTLAEKKGIEALSNELSSSSSFYSNHIIDFDENYEGDDSMSEQYEKESAEKYRKDEELRPSETEELTQEQTQ